MSLQFLIIAGPDSGKTMQLHGGEPLVMGRGTQAYFQLTDGRVSRSHCEIALENDKAVVTCMGGSGGTKVNGKTVKRHAMKLGDVLELGDTKMRLQVGDMPLEVAQAVAARAGAAPAADPSKLQGLEQLTGQTLSHYQIGHILGKGDSSVIFFANDVQNGNRPVAMKILLPEFSKEADEMERFVRAMKTVMPLRHPNLITIWGAGKTGPHCWVAMEYIAGESLTEVIKRIGVAGMLDWRHAYRVALEIGQALEYAHGEGIVHRNVTPRNIMQQTPEKTCKLGDLMLAKATEGAKQITRPGEMIGDVAYMSPERTRGMVTPDERSDLYGLGATLYALLAGKPPFEAGSLIELITKIRQLEPAKPSKFQMSIPTPFEGLVMKLLAKEPDDRFESATAMLKELKRVGKFGGMAK